MDEGLELWLAIIKNAVECPVVLLEMMPVAIGLLSYGTENIKRVLHIIEGYILLETLPTLQAYALPIIEQISLMLGALKPAVSDSLLNCIDVMLQVCDQANCFAAMSQIIYGSTLIGKLLTVVLEGVELSQVIIGNMMILSRMIMYEPAAFTRLLVSLGIIVFENFIDALLDRYDNIAQLKQKKLFGLALSFLIGTGHRVVIQKLEAIFVPLASIAVELNLLAEKESVIFTYEPRDQDDDELCIDFKRRSKLTERDVLFNNGSFNVVLKENLAKCEQMLGSQAFQQKLSSIDSEILHQIQHVLSKV